MFKLITALHPGILKDNWGNYWWDVLISIKCQRLVWFQKNICKLNGVNDVFKLYKHRLKLCYTASDFIHIQISIVVKPNWVHTILIHRQWLHKNRINDIVIQLWSFKFWGTVSVTITNHKWNSNHYYVTYDMFLTAFNIPLS